MNSMIFDLSRLKRIVLMLLGLGVLVALAGGMAYRHYIAVGVADVQATGRHRLDLYAASLAREIDKYAYFPTTLGLEQEVLHLLSQPVPDHAVSDRVNRYLEQLNERAGSLSIYILDRRGKVLATSNWQRPDSFLGEDLSFRPYFQSARDNGAGRFFGIGTTRGEPGYYLSSALSDHGQFIGVAVVKVGLQQLEKSWDTVEAPVVVADENGVVILSSVSAWKFTTLRPLDAAARSAFDQTQQYNRRELKPLGMIELEALPLGGSVVRLPASRHDMVGMFPVAGSFVAQTEPLKDTPWTITVFSPQDQVRGIANSRATVAGVCTAFLCLLTHTLIQRRRHLKDRLAAQEALKAANNELEQKVRLRTADLLEANERMQLEIAERVQAESTLRTAQEKLIHAGKLAVIGELSAGIAHELNQPLAALRTLSANARKFLDRGDLDTAHGNLSRIADLVDRMGRMTQQLKSFARKSSGENAPHSVKGCVDNALFLLEQRINESKTQVMLDFEPEDVVVHCDGSRLEQVLVNLFNNALDAMINISHRALVVQMRTASQRVRISVRDHGPGLDSRAQEHLFEAFFTTKDAGAGLGLGLAISAGIIADFGGNLSAHNHPDGGAEFIVDLPLAGADSRGEQT